MNKLALSHSYPMTCPVCSKDMSARPSLAMHFGLNSGHGTCKDCGAFLHLEIGEDGATMTARLWDDNRAELQEWRSGGDS